MAKQASVVQDGVDQVREAVRRVDQGFRRIQKQVETRRRRLAKEVTSRRRLILLQMTQLGLGQFSLLDFPKRKLDRLITITLLCLHRDDAAGQFQYHRPLSRSRGSETLSSPDGQRLPRYAKLRMTTARTRTSASARG